MLRNCAFALILLLGCAPVAAGSDDPLGQEEVRSAAAQFGRALTESNPGLLKSVLPKYGKVRTHLVCFGPEQGSFSAGQVEALLRDFLRQGSVRSFELVRTEAAKESYAVVRGKADVIDRDGVQRKVHLNLTFQAEGNLWVLREIRETSP